MRIALIRNGNVENVVFVEEKHLVDMQAAWAEMGYVAVASEVTSPGDAYDGKDFARVDRRTLEDVKAERLAAIQARTDELCARGYEYPPKSGHFYSLGAEAKALRTRLLVTMNLPAMAWPLKWPTVDYSYELVMNDPNEAAAFVIAESLAVRDLVQADAQLKAMVAKAATIAEVEAVTDTR